MKRTSAENAHLMKRIKNLENQKMTLVAQVRKLQASLARCSGQTAQPSTCLFVLIMSLALVLAPTLKNNMLLNENNDDEGISLSEDNHSAPLNTSKVFLSPRTRDELFNLLFMELFLNYFHFSAFKFKELAFFAQES